MGLSNYKRESFCGPAGDGPLSKFLSFLIAKVLNWMKLDFEDECENHDINWDDGPDYVDDMQFSLDIYKKVRKKSALLALIMSLTGLVLVRCTALVYKLLSKL